MAQVFSSIYYGFFIYLAVYTGRDTGMTAKTGIAFVLVLVVAAMLFGDTITKGVPPGEGLVIFAGSLVYALVYVGFFAYLCFRAGREEDGPVPDRVTWHG
jgi:hypothetical protein